MKVIAERVKAVLLAHRVFAIFAFGWIKMYLMRWSRRKLKNDQTKTQWGFQWHETLFCDFYVCYIWIKWRGWALDFRSTGRGFKSHSGQSCVTTLGKLFTPMCLCNKQYNFVPAKGRWCSAAGKVTVGLAESAWQPTAGWMTYSHLRADCLYTGISSGPNAR